MLDARVTDLVKRPKDVRADVLMLVSNGCAPDPRVEKEAQWLSAHGWNVTVLAWDRAANLPREENTKGFDIIRFARRSRPGSGFRQAAGFAAFWWWAAITVVRRRMRPAIVHCHDLDMYMPARLISWIRRRPLVFDAHEIYAEMQATRMPRAAVGILRKLESRAIRKASRVVVVGESMRDYFNAIRDDLVVIGNWQEPVPDSESVRHAVRSRLGIPREAFVIAYLGGLSSVKNLDLLIEAINADPDLFAIVAGAGDQEAKLRGAAERQPRLKFVGFTTDPAPYYHAADALYYLFAEGFDYARFSSSNALGMSFAYAKPLVTERSGDTGRIASQMFPELTLRRQTLDELLRVIDLLRNDEYRSRVSAELRKLAIGVYSWSAAVAKLEAIYLDLIDANRRRRDTSLDNRSRQGESRTS